MICSTLHRVYSPQLKSSVSIGIALMPRDGTTFEEAYQKADTALYDVKSAGKNNYAFFNGKMGVKKRDGRLQEPDAAPNPRKSKEKRRRMLIVEDSKPDAALLKEIFKNEYIVDVAADGSTALARMRHYGTALSVVLLDLRMPGMDGLTVLGKMRENEATVPTIVVSADDDRETILDAVRAGATDYIAKPVDPSLLRLRVESAVSKAENESLRAQNSLLAMEASELSHYRAILDSLSTVSIKYDWKNGVFTYDPAITAYLYGTYDKRPFWQILLSDMVANAADVERMQESVHGLANDRKQRSRTLEVEMKTPSGAMHRFCLNILKLTDGTGLTDKLVLSLTDKERNRET